MVKQGSAYVKIPPNYLIHNTEFRFEIKTGAEHPNMKKNLSPRASIAIEIISDEDIVDKSFEINEINIPDQSVTQTPIDLKSFKILLIVIKLFPRSKLPKNKQYVL